MARHLVRGSLPMSADLVHQDAGFQLSKIEENIKHWSQGDQMHMRTFICSARTQTVLVNLLKDLNRWQSEYHAREKVGNMNIEAISDEWSLSL